MTEEVTYVGWNPAAYFVCYPGTLPRGLRTMRPGEYKFLALGPCSNRCRGVSDNFVLLPQTLPSQARVLSEDENEERLANLRARIYLDPPVERNCFSRNLIVNTVLGDKFEDGMFLLLYNNGTSDIDVRELLCNGRNVYQPWKFVLLHRHVTLHDFHRGDECFPTVATAAAICLTRLTAQSLIAHNNRRLVQAGLPERQCADLPERPAYNTYGSLASFGRTLLSDEEEESNSLDELAVALTSDVVQRIGPQSGGYSPTTPYISEDDVNLDDDGESSDGVGLNKSPKRQRNK